MGADTAGRLQTLDAIQAEIWRQLEAATGDTTHPWRTPVLATINGHLADARTVASRARVESIDSTTRRRIIASA